MTKAEITKELKKQWGFPIFMNVVVMALLVVFFYAAYKSELDIIMQTLLYGVSEEGDFIAHLIFSNVILGKILTLLMQLMPHIAWYTVFHYAMAYLCLVVISYVILCRVQNNTGKVVSTVVSVFLGYECYLMPMYMKTAALLAATGVLLLWCSLESTEKKRIVYILAGVLSLIGALVSYRVFLLTFLSSTVVMVLGNIERIRAWAKARRNGKTAISKSVLYVECTFACILLFSLAMNMADKYSYQRNAEWNTIAGIRNSYEQLYSCGFPAYNDIEDVLKDNGFPDLTEGEYEAIKEGIYPDRLDMFALLQFLAKQHETINTEKLLLFFHTVPIRAFHTGMFYLWMMLAVILLYQKPSIKTALHVAVSLLLASIPYCFAYFLYGYESQQLGVIAYLPALMYLGSFLRDFQTEKVRYFIVFCALTGIALYYIFSDAMTTSRENTEALYDIMEIAEENPDHLCCFDFNRYISRFSIYQPYPQGVNTENRYLINGIYAMVPGYRSIRDLSAEEGMQYRFYDFYSRGDGDMIKLPIDNVDARLGIWQLPMDYGDDFHYMVHIVFERHKVVFMEDPL